MIWNMRKLLLICLLAVSVCLTGCSFEAVPSRYDMKLKSDTSAIEIENGGGVETVEVTVDSRSFHDMSSETDRMFLSYHLLDHQGNILIYDGIRTSLDPIPARGIKKERVDIQIPLEAGNYTAEIDLVEEGVTWFSEQGMETLEIPLTVLNTYVPPYTEVSLRSETKELEISVGDKILIPVTIENTSEVPLYSSGTMATRLSYHISDINGNMLQFDGERIALPESIQNGEIFETQVELTSDIFDTPGNYVISFDLVIEGMTWYADQGMETLNIPIEVQELQPQKISEDRLLSVLEDDSPELNMAWRLIQQTMENTTTSLTLNSGDSNAQYYGLSAGNIYPQFWVRDNNTALHASRFFNDEKYLNSWIELHLSLQGDDGNIHDWVMDGGITDKNTVETDQETSLVQAAYNYCLWSGNDEWLMKEIKGVPILQRLENAMQYLLKNKLDASSGLLVGAHTIDWGDVELGQEDYAAVYADENSIWTIDIYDQSMFVIAAKNLSELYSKINDDEKADHWEDIANNFAEKTRKQLWMPEKGYFRICSHVTDYIHDFDEDSLFGMGGNAMAVLSGIADEEMAASIFDTAVERQNEYGITTISGAVLPPYPEGTFSHPAVRTPYTYQNGGQWDWFGARLITAMYRLGYDSLADQKLIEIAEKVSTNRGINEWEAPDGTPCGSKNYAGAAGTICQAIVEGRYGINWSKDELVITPSTTLADGEIALFDYASGEYLNFEYSSSEAGTNVTYSTDFSGGMIEINIPIPGNILSENICVICNGMPIKPKFFEKNGNVYCIVKSEARMDCNIQVNFALSSSNEQTEPI